ncbi:MAG: TolC family protein [Candidatus Xenobiia bacterium LiM19]
MRNVVYILAIAILVAVISCISTVYSQEIPEPPQGTPQPSQTVPASGEQDSKAAEGEPSTSKAKVKILTLQECINTAMSSRPDLISAAELIKAAKAVVGETMSAYYPQINLNSTVQRSGGPDKIYAVTSGSGTGNISGVNTFNTITNTTISSMGTVNTDSVSVSQYITDFGKTSGLVTASQESYIGTILDQVTLQNTIINSVKKSYHNCIAALELLKVKQENVAVSETHLKQSQAFYDVGRRSKIEVTKSEVDLASARLDMINTDNAYQVSCVTLINSIGLDKSFPFELDKNLNIPEFDLPLEEVQKLASVNRPEYLKYDAQIRAQKGRLASAVAAFYPTITGNGQYNWRSNIYPLDRYWQIGLTLSLPITDGNNRAYKVKENRAQLLSLMALKERFWQNTVLELESAWLAIKAAREKIKVSEKSVQQAEENFKLAQGRYAVGVGSNLEFSDAQILLLQAKTDYISSLVQYFNALADLEKSMGVELKNVGKDKNKQLP